MLVGAVGLWFSAKALYQVYEYASYNGQAMAKVDAWQVEQVGSDRFVLRAAYGFQVGEKLYYGESGVPKLMFLNEMAAERRAAELDPEGWTVWYAAKNPNRSQLGKVFPYKQCAYAAILLGVLVYFVVLGRLAQRESLTH